MPGVRTWFVSHVSARRAATLAARFPEHEFRPRIGTDLWYADKGSYEVRAHVLDVRPVTKGTRVGYRQRAVAAGHLVVVSGGTSHGVAMESPSSAATARSRAIAVTEGVLEAAHRVRSPFTVSGVMPRFAEPPHMQCSLLVLPAGVAPPRIGDEVPVTDAPDDDDPGRGRRLLTHRDVGGRRPVDAVAGHPSGSDLRHVGCVGRVRISAPSPVMAIVCSLWAVRLPVALRSVQPSASVTSSAVSAMTHGSRARRRPGRSV